MGRMATATPDEAVSTTSTATAAVSDAVIEGIVSSEMFPLVQPGILKIKADDVQAHCT